MLRICPALLPDFGLFFLCPQVDQYSAPPAPRSAPETGSPLNQNTDTITQRYEIEIEGKNDQELGYFEFLFTSNGELLQKRRMYKRSFDNVW